MPFISRRWRPWRPIQMLWLAALLASLWPGLALAGREECSSLGWTPTHFQLKDHTVFQYRAYYYLASIYLSESHYEDRFAYARSTDLCNWEELAPILTERQPGGWDEFRIWAPFVWQEEGIYYLFYTGVTEAITQSILLATSTDPADPHSWQTHGVIFQPFHTGMLWPGWGAWSDARDPMVLKEGDLYYLYYTGLDLDGGIVGVATARNLLGPWRDRGATVKVADALLESPGVFAHAGSYYLFYNRTRDGVGPQVRTGATPLGPWSPPYPLWPGWGHEVWPDQAGAWMVSYLTGYRVTIRPLQWDTATTPPRPHMSPQLWHRWLPLLIATAP